MTKNALHFLVFLAGLAVLCWIGAGYAGSSVLGLLVTAVIAACYLAGAHELLRYRQASASLRDAVAASAEAQSGLAAWLQRIDPSLRNAVRLRIEGERAPLPAPALTPYLVGLLVLLGMLGTLLGMMATLRGTGLALESGTDLQAIRGALAAPVKGLGFAFGTSIAGVAASAMLGLLSALCRRERLQAVQALDLEIAGTLRPHSQAWQREETFRLMQQQATLMPGLLERLQAMVAAIEHQAGASGERLAAGQQEFHARSEAAHAQLASSLESSLRSGMAESAQALHAALQPAVAATLAGLAGQAQAVHESVAQAFDRHALALVEGLATRLDDAAATMGSAWSEALSKQEASNHALALRNEQALASASAALERHAAALMARDTAMLEERTRLIAALGTLLDAVDHASGEQRGAIDALVSTSTGLLEQVGSRFGEQVQAGTGTLDAAAAQVAAGAAEVASLGDAFGAAVQQFGRSSDELATRLQAIEGALERSLSRSDEQLAYYVAQAREVIDLSLLSQKQIVADLRQAAANAGSAGADAA